MLFDEQLKKSSQFFFILRRETERLCMLTFHSLHPSASHEQLRRASIPGWTTSPSTCTTTQRLQTHATASKLVASRMDRAHGARRDAILLQCCIRNELMGQANTCTTWSTWPAWYGATRNGTARHGTTFHPTSTCDARATTTRGLQLSATPTASSRCSSSSS